MMDSTTILAASFDQVPKEALKTKRPRDKQSPEKERIKERIGNFNPKDNKILQEIMARFGQKVKHPELLSIANVVAKNAQIVLDRDAKRRKSVLLKWFEENWIRISPLLPYVILEGDNMPPPYPHQNNIQPISPDYLNQFIPQPINNFAQNNIYQIPSQMPQAFQNQLDPSMQIFPQTLPPQPKCK